MTKIEFEIFDDGKKPITCARDFGEGLVCQGILASNFGTSFYCRFFSEKLFHGKEGFLEPCKQCLKNRKRS